MVDLKMLRALTSEIAPLQFGKVGAPNVGATFDTDNCVRLGADLIESTQCVAPVTASINLKDLWVLEESRGNPSWPSVPLGQGKLDIPRVIAVLYRRC